MQSDPNAPSTSRSFADVAHQTLIFDAAFPAEKLILELIDTRWVQRLRHISQTGNTKLVYMFAEHSRFGHSLGVAYLATLLMKALKSRSAHQVEPYELAVAAAALLHDIGHVAPGSHLAEKVWSPTRPGKHETVSIRIIREDEEIRTILDRYSPQLFEEVIAILSDDNSVPPWTRSIISGGGWNADRGNWAIVDSAMCCVSYGRYNVLALIDAFSLSKDGRLVLQEARLDALTHFFVARDSMYRQVYQHRVLQAVDALTLVIAQRVRDLIHQDSPQGMEGSNLQRLGIFADDAMSEVLSAENYAAQLSLDTIFQMTEAWWDYHISRWCLSADSVLADLASRLRDRRLLKTIRLETPGTGSLAEDARQIAQELGFDPRYYVHVIAEKDKHRGKEEQPPTVLLDSGEFVPVTEVEPLIKQLLQRSNGSRSWLAVPKEVKERFGRHR